MTLPLVRIPKRVVYVDDKGSFLEVLRTTTPRQQGRQFITSPLAALDILNQERPYWSAVEALFCGAAGIIGEGRALAPWLAGSYFSDWRRFHLTSVLIVDYAMPELNGVELIERLGAWPGRKLMLTGQADSEVALKAFNAGSIQQFLPKSTPRLASALKEGYEQMHRQVCEHLGHLLRPTLPTAVNHLLHEPSVARGIEALVRELDWAEYVVIGKPFGLLGASHGGPLQWMQLETGTSLREQLPMLEDSGYSERELRNIREACEVTSHVLVRQFGSTERAPVVEARQVSSQPLVVAGVFDLDDVPILSADAYGIDDIMSPEEELRSLLRACRTAHHQFATVGTSPALAGIMTGNRPERLGAALDEALAHLAACAAQSGLHADVLRQLLRQEECPLELRAKIDAAEGMARMAA